MAHWQRGDGDDWRHAPPWKVAINSVLRWLQHGRHYCLLVYTKASPRRRGDDRPPEVLGYGFGWIEMRWGG